MKSNLLKRGFLSLLVTQFFGAANDNILKQVIIYMVTDGVWRGQLSEAAVATLFTLPFILLSGYGGQFADRFSKQSVTVLLKVLELPIAAIALVGLWTHQLWLSMLALILLAVHSTFFGPAKYGMVPELVAEGDLSRANGMLNMLTNVAVIVGTLAAGLINDFYYPSAPADGGPTPQPLLWLPGIVLLIVAATGLAASLLLPRLDPRDPQLRYRLNPVATYVESIPLMARTPMLRVALAWSYFYVVAGIALLLLPHYKDLLGTSYRENSYLLGALGVAIGVGCGLAGWISGHRIQPRLVPVGAAGMVVLFTLLGLVTPTYTNVIVFVSIAGIFAGFYIVPLQALLQHLSPENERGRFLGTANAMSFLALTIGAGIEWIAVVPSALPPNRVFLVCAAILLVGTTWLLWELRRYLASRPAPA